MKQGTMNILFFVLKTKLLKNGEAPVLMRITINGSYDDARIQRSVPLNLWNAAKGCSKGRDRASIALNTYIAELHARALEKHKELVLEQALITPKLILKRVFGKDTENAYIARYHAGWHQGNGNTGRHRLLSRYDQPVQERGEEIAAAYPLLLRQGGYHLP